MKLNILTVILFISVLLQAQETGVISGRVITAETEQPVVGANIILVGTFLGAAADKEGSFIITQVPVGFYTIQASAIGFETLRITDVVVNNVRPARFEIVLLEKITEVSAVTATGNAYRKPAGKEISTQTQSYEEIRRLPGGSEDVVRAISILPGVAQVSAGRNDLIVRGGAPSENLYVLDGFELSNINHFGTQGSSGGPLSFINLDYVERTSFSSGGFGPQFGNRLSSVLTINLREGRTDQFGGKATLAATQFGLNLEGPMGSNGSYLFSARRSYLDFIFEAAGFGFVPEYWDFLGKASLNPAPDKTLNLLAIGVLDNVKFFNDTREQRLSNSRILGSDQRQLFTGLSYRQLVTSGYIQTSAALNRKTMNYLQADSTLTPIFMNDSIEQESTLKLDFVKKFSPRSRFSAGGTLQFLDYRTDLFLRTQFSGQSGELTRSSILDTTGIQGGLYSQMSHRFDRVEFRLGLRMNYFSMIEKKMEWSPRFSMTYKLSNSWNLTASAGRYHQAPAFIWLVSEPQNRSLRQIRVDQFIAGAEYYWRSDTRISLETYFKDYWHYPASLDRPYLVMANTGAGFGGTDEEFASFGVDSLISTGNGWSRGTELLIQKKLSETPLYGTLAVTYSESRFTSVDNIERPGSFDQRWIVNVGGGYVLNAVWEFSVKFRYASGQPYTPLDSDGSLITSRYLDERLDANHSLDIRIDRRWFFNSRVLIVYLDVQNVYNRLPVEAPRWDPEEQAVVQDQQIGLLPSIGISLEF